MSFLSLLILSSVKIVSSLFFFFQVKWLKVEGEKWDKVRLVAIINHTSLYEPIFIAKIPWSFIWRLSRKMVAPGADKTLNRPIVGIFWRALSPGFVPISRKRDDTWKEFMESIKARSVIVIAPEGRMKRPNGLDLKGNKMSIRGGIADILEQIDDGNMVLAYSGGLHHVQVPGQKIPNLFRKVKLNIEQIDIANYKAQFGGSGRAWKKAVIEDLQFRLENNVPN